VQATIQSVRSDGEDYYTVNTTVTFPAGSTVASSYVTMTIVGDYHREWYEGLGGSAYADLCLKPTWVSSGAEVGAQGCITVRDDD